VAKTEVSAYIKAYQIGLFLIKNLLLPHIYALRTKKEGKFFVKHLAPKFCGAIFDSI